MRGSQATAIETLKLYYAGQLVYVTDNLLLFYRPGNKRRFVSPDVMVVKGWNSATATITCCGKKAGHRTW